MRSSLRRCWLVYFVLVRVLCVLFLLFHLCLMVIFGFKLLGKFQENPEVLNPFGKAISGFSRRLTPKDMGLVCRFYTKYTGTYTGYSFFSPNVFSYRINLSFVSNGKILNITPKTPVSKIRYLTFINTLNIKDQLQEREKSILIKSLSRRLFMNYPEAQKVKVFLKKTLLLQQFKKDSVLFFEADRHKSI